jgi:periplasmic divalent cation tolerance protein
MIIVKVTCQDIDTARNITNHLLERRLISSSNYFPIKSASSWTGKIQEVDEYIVFLKTRDENWEKVKDEVVKIHPYKVPCIIKINAEANKHYEDWINEETQ